MSATIDHTQILVGDGVRVRTKDLSFLGLVIKVNRVNLVLSSSVWGNPVEYNIRKTDCIGGQVDRKGNILSII